MLLHTAGQQTGRVRGRGALVRRVVRVCLFDTARPAGCCSRRAVAEGVAVRALCDLEGKILNVVNR